MPYHLFFFALIFNQMKMRKFLNFLYFEACICVFMVINYKEIETSISISNASNDDFENEDIVSMPKTNKGHILFFHHAGTTSHLNVLKSLAGGLLERGHKVTTAFYGKTQIEHDNYTEITFPNR